MCPTYSKMIFFSWASRAERWALPSLTTTCTPDTQTFIPPCLLLSFFVRIAAWSPGPDGFAGRLGQNSSLRTTVPPLLRERQGECTGTTRLFLIRPNLVYLRYSHSAIIG
jgi:hypothetical protein